MTPYWVSGWKMDGRFDHAQYSVNGSNVLHVGFPKQLVEEHAGRWQVPLPQLQVLRTALCYFTHGTVSFPNDCEHVQYTLGSLALYVKLLYTRTVNCVIVLYFGKSIE